MHNYAEKLCLAKVFFLGFGEMIFFQRIEKLFPANTRKVIGDDKPKLPLRGGLVRTMNLKGIDEVN